MNHDFERLVGRAFAAAASLFATIVAFVVIAVAIGTLLAWLLSAVLVLSVVIYVYPWVHNAGLALSDRVGDALAARPRAAVVTRAPGLFRVVFWMSVAGGAFLLPGAFLDELGLATLSPVALCAATLTVALCPGAAFGVGLTVYPDPLESPGGGPVARLIEVARDRFF